MKNILILTIVTLNLIACDFGADGNEIHILDKYYVGWSDSESNRCIYIKKSPESNSAQVIVSGYVFAVGNDSRYIIAKSINGNNSSPTYYQLIDTKGEYHTNRDNNNYWFFSLETEFNQKLKEFGISEIKFDKNYRKDVW